MSVSDMLSAAGFGCSQDVNVSLSTTATPEQLWDQWRELCQARSAVTAVLAALSDQADATQNEMLKRQLWTEHDAAWKQWRVLDAWSQVIYATHVFLTEGADFGLLDVDGGPSPF